MTAERLWDGNSLHQHPLILIEDGKIDSIASRETTRLPVGASVLDFPGATLGPAFFDVHIHG
ncbi:MAG: N-acetylglucosamine-6-phosphate deacetylase, partial [Terracidiphilus sp.]